MAELTRKSEHQQDGVFRDRLGVSGLRSGHMRNPNAQFRRGGDIPVVVAGANRLDESESPALHSVPPDGADCDNCVNACQGTERLSRH